MKRQQLLRAHKAAQDALADLEAEIEAFYVKLENVLPSLGSSTVNPDQLTSLVCVRGVTLDEENVVGAYIPVVKAIEMERL